jgi:hypothetical protein
MICKTSGILLRYIKLKLKRYFRLPIVERSNLQISVFLLNHEIPAKCSRQDSVARNSIYPYSSLAAARKEPDPDVIDAFWITIWYKRHVLSDQVVKLNHNSSIFIGGAYLSLLLLRTCTLSLYTQAKVICEKHHRFIHIHTHSRHKGGQQAFFSVLTHANYAPLCCGFYKPSAF